MNEAPVVKLLPFFNPCHYC